MVTIPTHKLQDIHQTDMAFLRYLSEDAKAVPFDYAHRDEYYLFLFVEYGTGRMVIDFNEYEVKWPAVHCVLPGQVHFPKGEVKGEGWVLAVESQFVRNEYKDIFEKASLISDSVELNSDEVEDLRYCASILHRKLTSENRGIGQAVVLDLLSFYIGMVAEIYRRGLPAFVYNRYADITSNFKSLLCANFQSMKRPSQYASELNISPGYLNEAVKKTTGKSVNNCIKDEIMVQAKRLLFYTKTSIKEIAQELGFEDWAYFTRFFTKAAGMSPSRFREQYLE